MNDNYPPGFSPANDMGTGVFDKTELKTEYVPFIDIEYAHICWIPVAKNEIALKQLRDLLKREYLEGKFYVGSIEFEPVVNLYCQNNQWNHQKCVGRLQYMQNSDLHTLQNNKISYFISEK